MSRLEIVSRKTGKTLGTIDENAGVVEISEEWQNQPRVNRPGADEKNPAEKDTNTNGNG